MKTLRQLVVFTLLFLLAAVMVSSCSSSRRLGCPMKITKTRLQQPQKPVC